MKSLKEKYERIVNAYIKEFEKKQDMQLEFWVGDEVGGICTFGDVLFFSFDDIRHDIDTNQPKGQILDWLYQSIERDGHTMNYKSWSMGLRYSDIDKIQTL